MFLALDSALGKGSVAVFDGDKLLASKEIAEKGQQAAQLVGLIDACLKDAEVSLEDIQATYCTVGPGGFTGIRIALATARALGMSKNIPVHGVTTLACIAAMADSMAKITTILPAGIGKVYTQVFDELKALEEPRMIAISDLNKSFALIAPNDVTFYEADFSYQTTPPIDAKAVGLLVNSEGFESQQQLSPDPVYIRPPDALPAQKII